MAQSTETGKQPDTPPDDATGTESADEATMLETLAEEAGMTLDDLSFLQLETEAGDFWQDLRDSLPDWLDEIIAIGLLVFGLLSFLALFDTSGAVVAVAWANILNSLFGYASILVAAGIFALGVIILLPRAGVRLTFPPPRILAVEGAFLCVLALLHSYHAEGNELRALARAGEGGGLIGWGLSALPHWLFGRTTSLIIFGLGLLVSASVVIGVRRQQIIDWFMDTGERLLIYGERLDGAAQRVTMADEPASVQKMIEVAKRRNPIMRVHFNPENLPPSVRAAIRAEEQAEEIDFENHPLFKSDGDELKIDYNLIGEVTNKRTDDGYRTVIRPDGRKKRYFSVDELKEKTKIGRRSTLLPDLGLLEDEELVLPEEPEINRNVVLIENTLLEFDIDIDVIKVQVGPTVTRYAVQPYTQNADGTTERTRLSKIASYHNDLSLALSTKRLRLEIPVPGTNYMGIEVPNKNPSVVSLKSVFESKYYYELREKGSHSPLMIPLGRDVSGEPVALDIAKMPHLLIAGTTGSGKSVAIAAMAVALLLNNKPHEVKLIMLDPKMVELSRFDGLPHLMGPVETDTERIIGVLKWCTQEMDRRYKLLEEKAVRNIDSYNEKYGNRRSKSDYMPHIVIMIDEIGDLMMSNPEDTERAVTRLAQMARAVGMHLVIATQRPSVDVITGLIKANFPGRIAFSVASGVDSRVILDYSGAEHLMGRGDMLYLSPDAAAPKRVQGCFVSDEEVRDIVDYWKNWYEERIESGRMEYKRVGPWQRGLTRREFLAETDPMLEEAIEYVIDTQEASASMLQRVLGLGYPRAARIIDMLAELGVVGEAVGGGRARKVLIPRGEDPFQRLIDERIKKEKTKREEQIGLDVDE